MFGETYGFEVASTAQMTDCWSIKLAYSYLQSQLHLDPGSMDLGSAISIPSELAAEGGSPHNQVYARSSWDLGYNWQFDLGLRYVDNLPVVSIPAYLEGDARLAWRPRGNLELSVVGHNLFDDSHREFAGQILRFATGTEVERSVYGMVQYEY
jgi:iron complex outermembrane receptor protein